MRRAVLVLNSLAGTLAGRPDLPALIEAALRRAGFELTVIGDDVSPDISARLEAAIESDAPVILVGGGDGTIRSVAARLAGTDRILGVIPLGTLNLLARDLGFPLDPLAAAEALARAEPRPIDVGEVNGQVFLCQSVIGVPNTIGRTRQRFRRKGGFYAVLRAAMAVLRALLRQRPMRLMVNAPGWEKPWRLWTRAMSIVNNGYEEGTGLMFHRSRLDSSTLYLYVSRNFSIGWTAKMMIAMALGMWKRSSDIHILTSSAFAIHSRRKRLLVMNDGEGSILRTPLRYALRPRALNVLSLRPA
ncbi:diacylglycerol/lipid kinase family protein [Pararoseomonas indoligenes]|uniref:NAD(+)/NADH kinase n=1 Tax=Roseomonas indoligenes TaxID=2820811 RepID=A0A940S2X1_9PROT|nr:diacylglycerol kinase family protein [Pararoseomonas indoligenes]MBP0491606.1 NAD(+)/NADH kinase [Pararoseomonas indoligenes]